MKLSTIKKLAFEYPNIKFLVGEQIVPKLVQNGVSKQNIFALKLETWYDIGLCKVKLDYLYHDVPNYALHIDINGYKIIYATDTGKVEHIKAEKYNFAFIEANYSTDEELDKKIEKEKAENEFSHYERVKKTHLSQLQAINWLQKNQIEDYVFIHEHKERGKYD